MARKRRENREKKSKTAQQKSRGTVYWIVGAVIVLIAGVAIYGNILPDGNEAGRGKSFSVNGEETRPVLNPALFTGQARAAYEAAAKYREVLNQVFCYCYCDAEPFHHKTLLSCFTDRHGAG